MEIHFISGAAGFIGSNLVGTLLQLGHKVVGLDNYVLGSRNNISSFLGNPNFKFFECDISQDYWYAEVGAQINQNAKTVFWHMAANSDISKGAEDINIDLKNTFETSVRVSEFLIAYDFDAVIFASSSAVYGEHEARIDELSQLRPVSNYGVMKLNSEYLFSKLFWDEDLKQCFIFRFPNVVGAPATHGVLYDFIRKLQNTPHTLKVLGDGSQTKSYLHVDKLIEGMLLIITETGQCDDLSIVNIGPSDRGVTVKFIAENVVKSINPEAHIIYGEGNKGWKGDVPKFAYNIEKIQSFGWKNVDSSEDTILKAIEEIKKQFQI